MFQYLLLLLLLLSRFSRVRLYATPQTGCAAHQAPPSWDYPGKNTGVGCHFLLQYMKVKSESQVAQSCPTLSDPMDCSLPGSSIHGIFQAGVLEWGAIALICLMYNKRERIEGIKNKSPDNDQRLKVLGEIMKYFYLFYCFLPSFILIQSKKNFLFVFKVQLS